MFNLEPYKSDLTCCQGSSSKFHPASFLARKCHICKSNIAVAGTDKNYHLRIHLLCFSFCSAKFAIFILFQRPSYILPTVPTLLKKKIWL